METLLSIFFQETPVSDPELRRSLHIISEQRVLIGGKPGCGKSFGTPSLANLPSEPTPSTKGVEVTPCPLKKGLLNHLILECSWVFTPFINLHPLNSGGLNSEGLGLNCQRILLRRLGATGLGAIGPFLFYHSSLFRQGGELDANLQVMLQELTRSQTLQLSGATTQSFKSKSL